MRFTGGTRAVVLTLVGVLALGACHSGSKTGTPTSGGMAGTYTVGSKDFTESILLGKMLKYVLENSGAAVKDKTNIKGSANARNAMLSGEIDMYWEYTGTAWLNYLKHSSPITDSQQQYTEVRDEDLAKNKVVWLPMSPMSDTYALAVRHSYAESHNLTASSQLASLPPAEQTYCLEEEFMNRPDGWPGFENAYGLSTPKSNIKSITIGSIYKATADGKECNIGEVFTTDARIKALSLTVLEDDKKFFPSYNASVTMLKKTLDAHPELEQLLSPISAKLTDQVMLELNAQVDVQGDDPDSVAKGWLQKEGLIS
jgi:osmoprotectant transport system substrate-binding protein